MKNFNILMLAMAFDNIHKVNAAFAGVCDDCDPLLFDVPDYLDGCDDDVQSGGIAGWIALRCDKSFTDITDEIEWDTKIAAEEVFGRFDGNLIRGSLPVPDRNNVNVGACGTEKTVSKTYTASLIDSAHESTLTKYDLYNYVDQNGTLWNWGFITCDGYFYGFYPKATAAVDENIPETNSEVKDFNLTISWIGALGVNKPVYLPFLTTKKLHV
jgi:hypothetical protein